MKTILNQLDYSVLAALSVHEWVRSKDVGGQARTAHSRSLSKLCKNGLVERKPRMTTEKKRPTYLYRITDTGRSWIDPNFEQPVPRPFSQGNTSKVDWSSPDWSYLLGVVHGDGSIGPRDISITVGYGDADYADVLESLLKDLGLQPAVYRAHSSLRICVMSTSLRAQFSPFKENGIWTWPNGLSWSNYIAGVVDTDGCVTNNKSIVVALKRSGNLHRLAAEINRMGVRPLSAKDTETRYAGRPYFIETIVISGMDRIIELCKHMKLRHPRKAARLATMLNQIREIQSHVPLHREVSEWLKEEPRTWREIAARFNLTKRQVDSALLSVKKNCDVEIIPPPESLTRYRVKGP